MEQEKIIEDISNLPPEAQRQIVEFIDFIKSRYPQTIKEKQSGLVSLTDELFVGMWKDREDIKDSGKWLRNIRKSEWGAAQIDNC